MAKKHISAAALIAGILLVLAASVIAGAKGFFDVAATVLLAAGLALAGVYAVFERAALGEILRSKAARSGLNAAVYSFLVAGIIVFIQAITSMHPAQLDLTKAKRYSLSDQTEKVLSSLGVEMEALHFYSAAARNQKIEDTLRQYSKKNPKFSFQAIDADKNPAQAKRYNVTRYGVIVLHRKDNGANEQIDRLSEEAVTNAILKLTRSSVKTVYFTKGHGEPDLETPQGERSGISMLKEAVMSQNYRVKDTELFTAGAVPDDCSILVIAGPRADLFDREVKMIEEYLAKGRHLMVFYGNFAAGRDLRLPNLEALLLKYGIKAGHDVVIDKMGRMFGGDYLMPIISQYEQHEITQGFRVASFFPLSRTIELTGNTRSATAQKLALTNPGSWGETDFARLAKGEASQDASDVRGPAAVAAIATDNASKAMVAVFGSSEFVNNAYLGSSGNKDLVLNTVSFLAEEKDMISIRAKENSFEPLFLSKVTGRLLFIIPAIVLPLIVLLAGIMVYVRRRMS